MDKIEITYVEFENPSFDTGEPLGDLHYAEWRRNGGEIESALAKPHKASRNEGEDNLIAAGRSGSRRRGSDERGGVDMPTEDLKDFVTSLTSQIRGDRPAPPADVFDEGKFPYGLAAGDNKFGFEDCPTCGKPATEVNRQGYPPKMFLFVDRLSAQEHRISAMCQACQDSTFAEDDDDSEDDPPASPETAPSEALK